MIPYFEIPSLHLFTLPGGRSIDIHAFGVLVAVAILVGVKLQQRRARQLGLDQKAISGLATHVVVVGFLVSHVFDVVAYEPAKFLRDPTILFTNFNISSFGGLLGAVFGLYLWRRKYGKPILPYADATVFGFVFAWVFGRLGCFTAHDHPGRHTTFFLAVKNFRPLYPGDSPLPRHDLGLYEALFAIALSLAFLVAFRVRRRPGTYIAAACLTYAPVRFLLDFLRFTVEEIPRGQHAEPDARYLGLTPGQYAAIVMFVYGLVLAWRIRRAPEPAPATTPATAAGGKKKGRPRPVRPAKTAS